VTSCPIMPGGFWGVTLHRQPVLRALRSSRPPRSVARRPWICLWRRHRHHDQKGPPTTPCVCIARCRSRKPLMPACLADHFFLFSAATAGRWAALRIDISALHCRHDATDLQNYRLAVDGASPHTQPPLNYGGNPASSLLGAGIPLWPSTSSFETRQFPDKASASFRLAAGRRGSR